MPAVVAAGAAPLSVDPADLNTWIREGFTQLARYIDSQPFRRMLSEMERIPTDQRDTFIRGVLLRPEELARRGLTPPDGITVQRSSFGDGRPTAFCVVKPLPAASKEWDKLTITFDNGKTHPAPTPW